MNPSIGDRVRVAERVTRVRRSYRRIARWVDGETAFRRRIPIRGRIALFGAAVVALTVVIFSALVYVVVERSLVSQQNEALIQRSDTWWRFLETGGRFARPSLTPPTDLNTSSDLFVQVFDASGACSYSSGTIDAVCPDMPSSVFDSVPFQRGVFKDVRPSGGPLVHAYVRAWNRPDLGISGYLLVGQPQFGIQNQLDALRLFLIAGVFLSLVGAGAASWLVAGRALRPLRKFFRGEDVFLVLYGDVLTDLELRTVWYSHATTEADATVVVARVEDPTRAGLVAFDRDQRITRFVEKPAAHEVFSEWANAGIYLCGSKVLRYVSPGGQQDFARDLFPAMLADGCRLQASPTSALVIDFGSPERLELAGAAVHRRALRHEMVGEPC